MNDAPNVRLRGCVAASSAMRCPILLCLGLLTLLACLAQPAWAFEPGGAVSLTDLKPEIQATMFQGTIEAVDLEQLSLIIKTDFGRILSLSLHDAAAMSGLHKGDRVWLEADGQGLLTVKKLHRHDVPLTRQPKPEGRTT